MAESNRPFDRRIVLVRHARSAHVHSGWIDASGFRAWREAYEAAGIREGEQVPADLDSLANRAELIVASDTPRAVATARLLAPGREIATSPLLRELDLECPDLGRIRLPLGVWAFAVGGRILSESIRGRYPSTAERDRIEEARAYLSDLSVAAAEILVVTHASFRRRLAERLIATGWNTESRSGAVRPWSAWSLVRRGMLSPGSP